MPSHLEPPTEDARGAGEAWRAALAHVTSLARVTPSARGPALDPSVPVTVNFHPDHEVGGRGVVEHLAEDLLYRSQFETGTSNGGLTARPGGDRWRWESRLFGGAYDHGPADQRPVYGALDHRRRPAGGSVRFGSAHLRLRPHVLPRTTFCYPDSALGPTAFGTAEQMPLIALADDDDAVARYDVLDDYVEAHVHGRLRVDRDVEALVLDPSHRGTAVESAARLLPVRLEWHHGFRLHVVDLDGLDRYRGAGTADAAAGVAAEHGRDGWLDAPALGGARRCGRWDDQVLKRVWHCLARFGAPAP